MAQFDKMRKAFAGNRSEEESKGESTFHSALSPHYGPDVTVTPPACIYCGNPADLHSENFPYCSRDCGVLAETRG